MPNHHVVSQIKNRCFDLSRIVSFLAAASMLCVLPLLFHDAFFDINRCKVSFVIHCMPALFTLMLIVSLPALGRMRRGWKRIAAPCVAMALFLVFCTISCVRLGFDELTLTGSKGRYGGLWFLLSCGAAFAMIAAGALRGHVVTVLILLTSAVCAALGIANAMGLDPLGFYERIKQGQEIMYMSTIGHFDFFGTYIVLMLGICGGQFVFGKGLLARIFGGVCALLCAVAAVCARTDSAFLGTHLVCAALMACSGGDYGTIRRALVHWAVCFAVLPLTLHMLSFSRFALEFSGPILLLGKPPVAAIFCVLACIVLILSSMRKSLGKAPWSRRRMMLSVGLLLLLCFLILFGAMCYFTFVDTEANLGGAANVLRMNESWGSLRGYVYKWAVQAYGDYSPIEKLLGRGLEKTRLILDPYFDDPAGLAGGYFNDTHCQPLQYLITGGLLTALAFVAFYVCITVTAGRHAAHDPLLCGLFAALVCYGMIMLINVTQPILLGVYFAISALAVSRIRYLSVKGEGSNRES